MCQRESNFPSPPLPSPRCLHQQARWRESNFPPPPLSKMFITGRWRESNFAPRPFPYQRSMLITGVPIFHALPNQRSTFITFQPTPNQRSMFITFQPTPQPKKYVYNNRHASENSNPSLPQPKKYAYNNRCLKEKASFHPLPIQTSMFITTAHPTKEVCL